MSGKPCRIVMSGTLCGLAALATYSHAAPPSFAAPVRLQRNSVTINSGALGTVAADFDNDGRVEFVSAASHQSSDGHFRLYDFNITTRLFTVYDLLNPAAIETPAPNRQDRFGGDLAAADIDGDGYLDIVLPESNNASGSGLVSWFKNPAGNLAGTWTENVITTFSGSGTGNVVAHLSEIAAGDLTHNGRADVVVRDVSNGVFVMRQNTNGTWANRQFIATNPREGLTLFNPDGDNDHDILLNGRWLQTVDSAAGTYTSRIIKGAEPWYPSVTDTNTIADYATKVEIGDFNGDGRDDFAITNSEELNNHSSTDSKPKGVQVFLAPADPINDNWTKVVLSSERFSWHSLEIGDIDMDGDLDIVTGISLVGADADNNQKVVAFLNNGQGTAFSEFVIASGTDGGSSNAGVFMYQARLGDVDGDGDLDLFAPHTWNDGPIRFYENLTAVPEPAVAAMALLSAAILRRRR